MADPPPIARFSPGDVQRDAFYNQGLGAPLDFLMQTPMCVVTNSDAIPFPIATQVGMPWNRDVFDPYGFHDVNNNTSRITPTYSGYYTVTTWFAWSAANTGYRQIRITRNANGNYLTAQNFGGIDMPNIGGPGQGLTATSVPIACNGFSDYIEIVGYQTSGAPLNALAGNSATIYFHSAAA